MSATAVSEDAPIEIYAYDDEWPLRFQEEQTKLHELLAPWLVGIVEHVGSTSVPGLAAKPIIDLMASVESLAGSIAVINKLSTLEYQYFPYKPDVMHWFCKPSPAIRTHHLHVVPLRSQVWNERLAFRDALRQNAEWRDQYAALKLDLARRFKTDREAYTDAKGPFIRSVLRVIAGTQYCAPHAPRA